MKTLVVEVDLAERISDRAGLGTYTSARVVLRYGVRVAGVVDVPIEDGLLLSSDIRDAINQSAAARERLPEVMVEQHLMRDAPTVAHPSWTVVVCTRDRPELLKTCLDSLVEVSDESGEIIVVDNAPSSDATLRLVARYPVRYASEEVRGLNRARMRGARLATGEIVIYADDDTVTEPGWIPALLKEFSDTRVGGVTGLTLPYALDTRAQMLFELYYGFGKGFRRRVFDFRSIAPVSAGAVGSGGNMAFRRELILTHGLFEAELDRGTPARTGGDLYGFYRILAGGYRIVYTPEALNWHQHRPELDELRETFYDYAVGAYALFSKCLIEHHELPAVRVGWWWFRKHHLRELARTLARRPDHLPVQVVLAAFKGTFVAPFAYFVSRRADRARRAAHTSTLEEAA